MRQFTPVFLAFLIHSCYVVAVPSARVYTLDEALKNKELQFRISGLDEEEIDESRHIGKSLKISVKNTGKSLARIDIPSGYILSPEDSSTQDMIITESLIVEVASERISSALLSAMCIKMLGSSPQNDDRFKFSKMASGQLLEACKYIEKMSLHNSSGQDLLWILTDGLDPYDISGDEQTARICQSFLSDHLDFEIDSKIQEERFAAVGSSCGYTQEYNLRFRLYLEKPSRLTLVLYNSKGEMERTFFDRPNQARGKWDIQYSLTGHNLGNRKFKAMLLVDGKEHSYFSFEFGQNFDAQNLELECINPQTFQGQF